MAIRQLRFIHGKELKRAFMPVVKQINYEFYVHLREEVPKDTKSLMRSINPANVVEKGDVIRSTIVIKSPYAAKQALEVLRHLPEYSHDVKGSISRHRILKELKLTLRDKLSRLRKRYEKETGKKKEKTKQYIERLMRTSKHQYEYEVAYRKLKERGDLVKIKTDFVRKAFEKTKVDEKMSEMIEKMELLQEKLVKE